MSEYIEREAVNALIKAECSPKVAAYLIDAVATIPAADVRPVVRGEWKPIDLTYGRNYYFCSACEETVDMPTVMGIPKFRYCPNCGAKMECE